MKLPSFAAYGVPLADLITGQLVHIVPVRECVLDSGLRAKQEELANGVVSAAPPLNQRDGATQNVSVTQVPAPKRHKTPTRGVSHPHHFFFGRRPDK